MSPTSKNEFPIDINDSVKFLYKADATGNTSLYFKSPKPILFHYFFLFLLKNYPTKSKRFLYTWHNWEYNLAKNLNFPWLANIHFQKSVTGVQFDSYSGQISWNMLSLSPMGHFFSLKKEGRERGGERRKGKKEEEEKERTKIDLVLGIY